MFAQDLRSSRLSNHLDREVPPVEEFLSWDSFSEVDQTRALLRALCLRSIAEIRVRYLDRRGTTPMETAEHQRRVQEGLTAAIRETRDQIAVFEGSAEEWVLHGELLRLLQRGERHAEWLDAFIDLVLRNPTDSQIESMEPRAWELARRLGRTEELQPVLAYWNHMPWNHSRLVLPTGAPGRFTNSGISPESRSSSGSGSSPTEDAMTMRALDALMIRPSGSTGPIPPRPQP